MRKSVSSWGWEQGHKEQVSKARRLYSKIQRLLKEKGVDVPNLPKEQEEWKWFFDDIIFNHESLLPKKEGKRCYFYYEYFKKRKF